MLFGTFTWLYRVHFGAFRVCIGCVFGAFRGCIGCFSGVFRCIVVFGPKHGGCRIQSISVIIGPIWCVVRLTRAPATQLRISCVMVCRVIREEISDLKSAIMITDRGL